MEPKLSKICNTNFLVVGERYCLKDTAQWFYVFEVVAEEFDSFRIVYTDGTVNHMLKHSLGFDVYEFPQSPLELELK
jgi:hypothetical protein